MKRVCVCVFVDAVKEFIKLSKKNKIYKLTSHIDQMFAEERFAEIIEQLEDFADTHRLVVIHIHSS